jgi:hypothetical protein
MAGRAGRFAIDSDMEAVMFLHWTIESTFESIEWRHLQPVQHLEPSMSQTWTRRLLLASAAWNLTGAATSLADPANHFAQMYAVAPAMDDALLMYFYQCTWINVLAWGLAYGLAAFWPQSRPAVLAAGGLGKAVYFLACLGLVVSGVAKPLVLAFGLGDLLMAVLFAWALFSMRRSGRSEGSWQAA